MKRSSGCVQTGHALGIGLSNPLPEKCLRVCVVFGGKFAMNIGEVEVEGAPGVAVLLLSATAVAGRALCPQILYALGVSGLKCSPLYERVELYFHTFNLGQFLWR